MKKKHVHMWMSLALIVCLMSCGGNGTSYTVADDTQTGTQTGTQSEVKEPAYKSTQWVTTGGPPGGLGYDERNGI